MIRKFRERDRKELECMLLTEGIPKEVISINQYTTVSTNLKGCLLGFYTYEPYITKCKLLTHFILHRKHRKRSNIMELLSQMKKEIGLSLFACNVYKSNLHLSKLVPKYFTVVDTVTETRDRIFYLLKLRRR